MAASTTLRGDATSGLVDSALKLLHDTSSALIDSQITTKLSDLVTGTIKAGFDVVDDVLGILKDLTEPKP